MSKIDGKTAVVDAGLRVRAWRALRTFAAIALVATAAPAMAFHFPWDQGHDTTNSNDPPPPGPCEGPTCDDDCGANASRSPVYAALGHAVWRSADAQLRGRPYLGVYRVYNSNDPVVGLFGSGWSVCFDVALYPANKSGVQQRIYKAANGKRFIFEKLADGTFKAPAGRFETVVEGSTSVTMTALDGRRHIFGLDGRLLERYDANGNRVNFVYDASARPTRMADDAGRFLQFTYNAAGLVDAVVDHAGRTWRYAYDVSGSLLTVTDPMGGVLRYAWQAYRPSGDANTYHQLLSAIDPSGVVQVSFTYSANRVASYTDAANRITYSRPASNTPLAGTVAQTDAFGASTSFTYGALGLVTRDVSGIGAATSFVYDSNGRIIATVDALGRTWSSTYDALGRMTSSANPLGQASAMAYAGIDSRPVQLTSPMGRVVSMTYDPRGNVLSSTDPSGAVTRKTYSARGDVVSIANALNQSTSIAYTAEGLPSQVTDPLGRISTMGYDALGRLLSSANAAGETTRFAYDALDRVVSITDPLNQVTTFTYDGAGRVLSTTDAKSSVTRYEYDGFGRRTAEIAPDGRRTSYAFRADNLLASVTWPDSTSLSYLYDNNKRVTRETAGAEVITYTYNAVNQLLSATGPGGTVSYTYDNAGRVLSESSGGRTNLVTRNADGERTGLSYLGVNQTYVRDSRGLVTRIASPAGTFDFSFDVLGRRTQLVYPNGSTASYGFDPGGQLVGLNHAGAFNAALTHTFDAAGRTTRISGDGPDWNYRYDSSGRLTLATRGVDSYAYAFDPVGNFLEGGRTYDLNHRLTSDANKAYAYDQRGNLTQEAEFSSGARTVYTWNVKNQLMQVRFFPDATSSTASRTLSYTYDPLGRRASKTDNGVVQRFVYDEEDLVGVLDSSDNVTATNVYSGMMDEPLASTAGGVSKLHYANHQGSIIAVTEGNAAAQTYRYGPYGQTLAGSSADTTPFGYTGREKDTDTLYFYRARYYSTATQRFIGADPIGLEGGTNPYAYVDGNPIGLTDPSGEFGVGGAAVGVLTGWLIAKATGQCYGWSDALTDAALGAVGAVGLGKLGATGLARGMSRAAKGFPRGVERVERSRWIPGKWGGPHSDWNQKLIWGGEHAVNDPARHRFMPKWWKEQNPMNPAWERAWNRTPDWVKGGAAGGAAGRGANAAADCNRCD